MESTRTRTVKVEDPRQPVTCPPRGERWDLHPRVYLTAPPEGGDIVCPYCGTRYIMPKSGGRPERGGS